jgi:hypothetical protein
MRCVIGSRLSLVPDAVRRAIGVDALTLVVALAWVGTANASTAGPGLGSLLARPSELPGFMHAEFRTERTSRALTYAERVLHKSPAQATAVVPRLRHEGFVRSVRESYEQTEAGGVSLATLFATPRGARQELAANAQEELEVPQIERFSDGHLPGALGFTGTTTRPVSRFANIYLAVGRCFLVLGDQIAGTPTIVSATLAPSAGLEAIYRRVKHVCS